MLVTRTYRPWRGRVAVCECCWSEGGGNGLTGQVGPGGDAADGVSGVAAQAIVQQLAVSQPKAQQDPVDLLLGGRLRGGREVE